MSEAVVAYEEKPRDQWLFDYPAQVSLCGTQIWWTTEVNMAFERLEEVHFVQLQYYPIFNAKTNIMFEPFFSQGYDNALKDYTV